MFTWGSLYFGGEPKYGYHQMNHTEIKLIQSVHWYKEVEKQKYDLELIVELAMNYLYTSSKAEKESSHYMILSIYPPFSRR